MVKERKYTYNPHNEILLGKRKGSHGAGEWSLPGGHLEFNESFEECCIREVKEETDIDIHNVLKFGFTNDIFKEDGKHYVTLFFETRIPMDFTGKSGAKLMEPDKCERWEWFKLENLPEPSLPPLKQIVRLNPIIEF